MTEPDPQGLEACYRECRAELLRFLIARTGDPGEAEEILQDMWLRLPAAARSPVANARAYLYRMAQNQVVDRLREKQRRMKRERLWLDDRVGGATGGMEPADTAPNAEDVILAREETALLASAIATIPEAARRAFELHKVDGFSHAEVAVQLHISKSGVEKHIAVAMKYLRRALLD